MKRKSLSLIIVLLVISFLAGCGQKEERIMRKADWQGGYPEVVATYEANAEMVQTTYGGSKPIDYLTTFPNLKTLYDGYGFSIEYARARGHVYGLEDVKNTARPKPGASCFACKTADFILKLEKEGAEVNKINFDEFGKNEMDTISCYDCHKNEPGVVNPIRSHFTTGLKLTGKEFKPGEMACGQCHVEYYIDPASLAITLPWHNGFGTDGMLEYYDGIGFKDWEHPVTGTPMLKAQHPETETFQGSLHQSMGLTCIDCHMPSTEVNGKTIKSHHWTSPLIDIENASCFKCHSNLDGPGLVKKVEGVQGPVVEKTNQVSDVLVELTNELGKAVANKTHDEGTLNEVRDYHRKAQFKWDFVFVENSEGFHNSKLAHQNLDEALALTQEGLKLLK